MIVTRVAILMIAAFFLACVLVLSPAATVGGDADTVARVSLIELDGMDGVGQFDRDEASDEDDADDDELDACWILVELAPAGTDRIVPPEWNARKPRTNQLEAAEPALLYSLMQLRL